MGFYIDVALIALWAVIILVYFFKGFFNALKPFRKWVALLVAYFTCGSVAVMIAPLLPLGQLRTSVYDTFYGMWSSAIGELGGAENITADTLNTIFGLFSRLFPGITDTALGSGYGSGEELASAAAGFAADKAVNAVATVISFLIVFLAVFILYTLVLRIVNRLCKTPVLNFFNRLAGGIFGAISGYCTLWIISFVIVTFLPDLLEGSRGFTEWVCGGAFSSYLVGLIV